MTLEEAQSEVLVTFLTYLDEAPDALMPNQKCRDLAKVLRANVKRRLRTDGHELDPQCYFCDKDPYRPHNLGDS